MKQKSKLKHKLWPHAVVTPNNALFQFELRRQPAKAIPKQLIGYSLKRIIIVQIPIIVLWLLFLIPQAQTNQNDVYSASLQIILWFFLIGFGVNIVLDFASMFISINAINGERISGRWDLLRLSNLSHLDVITAKYATAQLRIWGITTIIVAMRLSIGILLILTPIVNALVTGDGYEFLFTIPPTLIGLIGLFLLYLFEPLWRMKAIVALGIAISVREFSNPAFALLSGIGAIICAWIAQLVVVVGPPLLALTSGTNNESLFLVLCCVLPIWFYGAPALMIFLYERLRDWGLKYAIAYLAREQ